MTNSKSNTSSNPVYVACYGSLRRNMGNDRVNKYAEATLVGLGNTVEHYNLYAYCSGFPSVSLAHNSADKAVRVEVYQTTMAGLTGPYDMLEGYRGDSEHNFYNRTLVPVQMDNGDVLDCWIYHIDEEQSVLVESGDWCEYKRGAEYYESLED